MSPPKGKKTVGGRGAIPSSLSPGAGSEVLTLPGFNIQRRIVASSGVEVGLVIGTSSGILVAVVPSVEAQGLARSKAGNPTISLRFLLRLGRRNQYISTRIRGTTQRESRGKRRAASDRKRPYTVSADFGDGARDIVLTGLMGAVLAHWNAE